MAGGIDLSTAPRGIRNNNPGNIEFNPANDWKGQHPQSQQIDKRFCVFTEPEWGIRALMIILRNYQRKYNLNTVEEIINRWAPSNENDTNAYVNHVCKQMMVEKDEELDLEDKDTLINLSRAICKHENGVQPYSIYHYQSAWDLM